MTTQDQHPEQEQATAQLPPEYRGIRGAGSAARLTRLAREKKFVLPGQNRPGQNRSDEQDTAITSTGVLTAHVAEDDTDGPEAGPGARPDAHQAKALADETGSAARTTQAFVPVADSQAGDAATGATGSGDSADGQLPAVPRTDETPPAAATNTGTPVASIFAAAQATQASQGMGQAGSQPPAAPPVPLVQARAQAQAQHLPTRRPLQAPRPQEGFAQGAPVQENSSNVAGFLSFLKSILKKGPSEQTPDRSLLSQLGDLVTGKRQQEVGARSMTMQGQGLFAALDAPLQGLTPDDIRYAGDVDAAYSRRPKIGARVLSLTIAVFFTILIIWAAFSKIDEVTHSEGSVVGSQSTQTISNLEGGILRAMLVRDGNTVQKGDVLAQIDNEMAASSYRDAMQRSMDNVFALIRLEAELKNTEPVFPKDLYTWSVEYFGREVDPAMLQQAQQIIADQESVWRSRRERFRVDEDVLRSQAAQREREVQEQTTHREQLIQSLALSRQQRDAAKALVSRNNFSRLEYLGMEQKVVELQGQVDMLDATISKAQAAAAEAKHRIESHTAEFRAGITEEINKRRVELTTLQETLAAGGDRVTRTDVRSPVRGIIKQIYINTIGGVVKPGEPIMDIVPLDDTLLVEARVRPQDVAFLRPGQNVMVKVTAYDFSIYGGLEGKLEQISADTIEGKQGEFYYLVKIRTSKTYLEHNNEILPIIPGMIVQADILIGKKTILQYLMKPILKAKQNALTER